MQSPISMFTVVLLSAIFAFAFSRHHHHHHKHNNQNNNRVNTRIEDDETNSPIPAAHRMPRECPQNVGSLSKEWHFCPKPQDGNTIEWPCVRYTDLCNGLDDCPGGSDEDPHICFFHKLIRSEMNTLRKTVYQELISLNPKPRKADEDNASDEWIRIKT